MSHFKKNSFKKIVSFYLLIFVFFINQFYILKADEKQENQTFLEADYVKKNENNFFANGHVILRRPTMLFNADEIFIDKKKTKTNKENYKFYIKNWVKLRTDSDNILFAKSMFYDEENKNGFIKNAQIYPSQNEHREVYATTLEKRDDIFIMNNVSLCPCKIFKDSNVDSNRRTPFEKIDYEDELLEKPIEKNSIDNTDKEMHNKIKNTFLSLNMNQMIYDRNESLVTFKRFYLRLFGLPVFYLPSYSLHTNDSGDSGFLMPQIIPIGTRQIGIELPFYYKIRNNIDILLSRTQYFDLVPMKNEGLINDNAHKLKDLSRYRESSTQFRFRHLMSTKYGYENFYRIEGMMTDRTQLVDNTTALGKVDSNGNKMMGYRWMIDFRTRLKLTKTTFFKVDINLTSDKNLMYYYKFDPRQIQENKIHLYDVAENRYFSAEILGYQSRLFYLDTKTNPTAFPVLRGEFDFKKDRLGGNFYFKSKSYFVDRREGFDSSALGIDFGYHLPYATKFGTKITFDTMARGLGNYFNYTQYNSNVQNDNYGGIINGNYYAPSKYLENNTHTSKFGYNLLGFSKLQAEHPVIIRSLFGKTIFNPKLAFRFSGNNGRKTQFPAEDNIALQMNYYNAFDLVQSSGLSIYDKGESVVYGLDFKHQFTKNIEFFGGVSQNMRLERALQEEVLAEYTGFRRTMSDIFAHFGAKAYNFSTNGFVNYDQHSKEPRILGVNVEYSDRYSFVSVQYSSLSKNATFLNYPMQLLTLNAKIAPTNKFKIIATTMYNFKSLQIDDSKRKAGFIMYNVGAYYTISCLTIGFTISRTNFVISNTPSDTIIRIKIAFAGF